MKNIGPKSRQKLAQMGILTKQELEQAGVLPTYKMLRSMFSGITLNMLWGLEGAVTDTDWREISEERKEELLQALQDS